MRLISGNNKAKAPNAPAPLSARIKILKVGSLFDESNVIYR